MAFTKVVLTGTKDKIKVAFSRFNTLIDDLLSTTSGKGASQVGVYDSAGNMDAANVEDALAEIYSDTAGTRALADTLGVNSSTTTGLTWGYNAGTLRYDNTVVDVAAGTVSLTDNATNYIEVDSAGLVTRNTTAFTTGRIPIRLIVTLAGVQTTSTDKRSWLPVWDMPLPVAKGGTGAVTLTDGGILLGSGTGAITALGVATNGQIPIGDGTTDPVLAAPTGTANQITVTLGAGTIGLSLPSDLIPPGTVTTANTGLHILDTNASHDLIIKPGSDLTADKTLTLTTGDSDRTLTLSADMTLTGYASAAEIIAGTEAAKAIAPDKLAASGVYKDTSRLKNLSIAASVAAKALTVALKGEDGNDPSATNTVTIAFRDETLTVGTPNIRTVTGALSVALASGGTLGFTAAEAGRLYVWAIDNAGTVELALSRTADIFPESNLVTTVAIGSGSDLATAMYSTTQRTSLACRCIGYVEITTGGVAGEWDNAPTKIQIMGPGVKRTGDIVITQQAVLLDVQTIGAGAWTAITNLTITIAPKSAANKLLMRFNVPVGIAAGQRLALRITKDAAAIASITPTTPGNRIPGQSAIYIVSYGPIVASGEVLYSPGSAASADYAVELYAITEAGYINRGGTDTDTTSYNRGISTFTIIEIEG